MMRRGACGSLPSLPSSREHAGGEAWRIRQPRPCSSGPKPTSGPEHGACVEDGEG